MKKVLLLCMITVTSVSLTSCKKDTAFNTDGSSTVHDLTNLHRLNLAARPGTGEGGDSTDEGLIFDCSSCDTTAPVFINSKFNGTPMAGGNYIWVNLHIKLNNYPAADSLPLQVAMINGSLDFTANNVPYHATMPNAQIDFSDTATAPSSFWSGTYWHMSIPRSMVSNSEIFTDGFAMQIPVGGFPGGINPLRMTCTFKTNRTESFGLQWQWSAAVYSQFSMDYNDLNVKLIHTNTHAGTPQNFEQYVIGGAMGGGGSNYTGGWSSTGSASFN